MSLNTTPYLRFLVIGLVLGLYTEVQFKLIARVNVQAFLSALVLYPVILTVAYAAQKYIDRIRISSWKADVLCYMAAGIGGLAVEWGLLGNGPGSNANQLGMFAMWTTFCFGPRVLTRDTSVPQAARRTFWRAFGLTAVLLTGIVLLTQNPEAKIVIAVWGLSATYIAWSGWLLVLAWQTRQRSIREPVRTE